MPIRITRNVKPDFTDERGKIIKLLDDGKTSIKSALLITCKKGAVRANHYHKKDTHYVYMLHGSMEYTEQDLKTKKTEAVVVNKGDMVFTPPMTPHVMRFLEESAFLTLATESRSHEHYEDDTVRVKII
ncbi:cupin domain-containing protein [Candidatus Woesearchaeota archaeon]|nr:cupin domain-containing protein [Candidatus Woesearchaeota archaeon]